jgi:hemin uptake protein HemP
MSDQQKFLTREPRETPTSIVRTTSATVLKGAREAIIEHDGQEYRLRVTSSGKLILTK